METSNDRTHRGLVLGLAAALGLGLVGFVAADTSEYRAALSRLAELTPQAQRLADAGAADYARYKKCLDGEAGYAEAACLTAAWAEVETVVGVAVLATSTEIVLSAGAPEAGDLRRRAAEGIARGWTILESTRALDDAMNAVNRARSESMVERLFANAGEQENWSVNMLEVQERMLREAEQRIL